VLFAHGNAGNVSHRVELLRRLHDEQQVAVMGFDYRGYGRSGGAPTQEGILQDARAARKWLAARTGVDRREIVLLGRSLGGAVMVDLAAADGARALVLESTFTSVRDVASSRVALASLRPLMQDHLNSLAKISAYRGPLLQSHGDADNVIPFRLGRRLFEAAGQPKTFVTIPGGDHNDPQTNHYYRVLDRYLATLPPPRRTN
jgi:fermentation-respiration switch protein FrsA (DUF1100 family)